MNNGTRYEGSVAAPCVIDLGTGGIFKDDTNVEKTIINVPDGIPKGVIFPSGFAHTVGWSYITCSRVDALNGAVTNITSLVSETVDSTYFVRGY